MSRYMINKLIREIEMSDARVAAYIADPPGVVAAWLEQGATPARVADDRSLDDDERRAFEARDYAKLYELGAHPYLLWHWVEAVFVAETTWPELNAEYKRRIAPLGYPDYLM